MQNGSVTQQHRKKHSDVWHFRWWERTSDGRKVYRRREIGTIDQIPDMEAARRVAQLLVPGLNTQKARSQTALMTIVQLCDHFEYIELCTTNTWRSYSTKHIYKVYLRRWIIPKWGEYRLNEIQTIEVETLASRIADRTKYLRKDPKCHVSAVQSCLQV